MDLDTVVVVNYKAKAHPIILLEDIYQVAEELLSVDFRARQVVCIIDPEDEDELKSIRGVDSVELTIDGDY